MSSDLWKLSACRVVDMLQERAVSPGEVLDSLIDRIAEVNPVLNALPTLCLERARDRCRSAAEPGEEFAEPLYGLPVPIKDSYDVHGVRTTLGSLAFEHRIAERSDLCVQQIEARGGNVYAKSNTPEFEAGASTFNEVFGRTVNPWNTGRSAAGSSGGAAAAVASGMAFIAQGSDFACSLRYPAAFCGVTGLRPTPGLVPQGPGKLPHQTLSVIGPLGRTVADLALALDAMSGWNPLDPLTFPASRQHYRRTAETPTPPRRVAFSMDLGVARVSSEIRQVVESAVAEIAAAGCPVESAQPDLSDCHAAFRPLRAFQFSALYASVLETARDKLKPEVVWNIEQGLQLTASELTRAEHTRAALRGNMIAFLDEYDFLITPTTPVPPNPAEERFVAQIDESRLETYLDWLVLGYAVSVTGCPAISIPCAFTSTDLPVGLQIIAKPHHEAELLAAAAWLESVFNVALQEPISPRIAPQAAGAH